MFRNLSGTDTEVLLDDEDRLGDILRGERFTLNKSLDEVANDLHIKEEYIEAIEEGQPDKFKSNAFVAGYTRSYAEYLGLDPDKVYQRFCEETGFQNVTQKKESKKNIKYVSSGTLPRGTDFSKLKNSHIPARTSWFNSFSWSALGSVLVLLALIVGIGYVVVYMLTEFQRVKFAPVNQIPGVATKIEAPNLDRTNNDINEKPSQTIIVANEKQFLEQLYRPEELEVPELDPRDGPIAILNPDKNGILANVATSSRVQALAQSRNVENAPDIETPTVSNAIIGAVAAMDGPKVIGSGDPSVAIVASDEAWVRVYFPDRSVLFEKILIKGERFVLPRGLEQPLMRAGNSGSVYVMIGQKVYGPVGVKTGPVKNVSLVATDILENQQPAKTLWEKIEPKDIFDTQSEAELPIGKSLAAKALTQ